MESIDFSKLKEEMPYRWRVQSTNQYSSTLVAYIDSRDVQDRLDEVCGTENWSCDYKVAGTQMIAEIGIKCDGEWVFKHDGGSESQVEKEKGLLSDSFKRAAIMWGIGRFLYNLVPIKLKAIDTGKTNKKNEKVYAPAHDFKKFGPIDKVPFGLLKWNGKENTLEITDVNRYIDEVYTKKTKVKSKKKSTKKAPSEPENQEPEKELPKRSVVNASLQKCDTIEKYQKLYNGFIKKYGFEILKESSGKLGDDKEIWLWVFEPHLNRINGTGNALRANISNEDIIKSWLTTSSKNVDQETFDMLEHQMSLYECLQTEANEATLNELRETIV